MSRTKASDVEAIVLELAPLAGGVPGDRNGIVWGSHDTRVTGIAVTWTPTVAVLREAAMRRLNFIITHEWPWFVGASSPWFAVTPEDEKPANIARRQIVDAHQMVLCCCHSNWDGVRTDGVVDSLARTLGFFVELHSSRYLRVYQIHRRTLAELAMHVKLRLGVPNVRVAGDLGMEVERVGVAVGGLAQNWNFIDELVANGAQAVVVGECIDYSVRIAVDSGVGLIETSHVASENPGMRNLARLLDDVPVEFIDAGQPWVHL
ncbi:MAG: Nif3-like dinuclear metal center hexameric protein [Armatimonadetes bacterium]|nr:Nif3-like dinuclear metal center hexameric protein [Armatimonadota bacterium]